MRNSEFGRELSVEECLAVSGGAGEPEDTGTSTEEGSGSDPSRGGKVVLAGG
jgi:hypothetical protein